MLYHERDCFTHIATSPFFPRPQEGERSHLFAVAAENGCVHIGDSRSLLRCMPTPDSESDEMAALSPEYTFVEDFRWLSCQQTHNNAVFDVQWSLVSMKIKTLGEIIVPDTPFDSSYHECQYNNRKPLFMVHQLQRL